MTWFYVKPHYKVRILTAINESNDQIDWSQLSIIKGDENALYDWFDDFVSDDDVNDYIDECNDSVEICGLMYSPSHVLEEIDPYAWSEIRDDYINWKVDEYLYEHPEKPVTYGDLAMCNGIWYENEDEQVEDE